MDGRGAARARCRRRRRRRRPGRGAPGGGRARCCWSSARPQLAELAAQQHRAQRPCRRACAWSVADVSRRLERPARARGRGRELRSRARQSALPRGGRRHGLGRCAQGRGQLPCRAPRSPAGPGSWPPWPGPAARPPSSIVPMRWARSLRPWPAASAEPSSSRSIRARASRRSACSCRASRAAARRCELRPGLVLHRRGQQLPRRGRGDPAPWRRVEARRKRSGPARAETLRARLDV